MPMRILAVADIYEALTADRPYRTPLPVEKALDLIDREVPHRLDRDARRALECHLAAPGPAQPWREGFDGEFRLSA